MIGRYKPYIVFVAFVAVGLTAIFLVSEGYYPVLLVEGEFISVRRFSKDYRAASLYYENFLRTYGGETNEEKLEPKEIQLSVLEQLVEDVLVRQEMERRVGRDADALIANKIEKFKSDENLGEAVTALYGFSLADFEREVLIPQAEREVLMGRLFLDGEKIEVWLEGAKKSASVMTFSSAFHWKDGKMEEAK
ncbi:hypothetical protein C4571_00860 [Candidatus Parcubacteria bacterium]|nr:MAG: hypothetical protein C4571_00860 [Candidatus Parcubacteria bacterium]